MFHLKLCPGLVTFCSLKIKQEPLASVQPFMLVGRKDTWPLGTTSAAISLLVLAGDTIISTGVLITYMKLPQSHRTV